jgi:hypothetical protein
MSVTSTSAKIKFTIGSFDYDTTLVLPATTEENKLTLEFEELVTSQLTGWGDIPRDVYVLLDVKFEGEDWYKNPQYDSPSTTLVPTDPDITIVPDANPATVETVTINNLVPMVTDISGDISIGTYIVNAKFVYWANDTAFGSSVTAFTADLSWESKEPTLSEWYDTQTPKLQITDGQSYVIDGVTADRDTEFVLSPPQNRAEVVNTFDNIQKVSYTSFWTGGNEMTYTILLTYTFTTYIIENVQQDYSAFTVYNIDNCKIFNCLKDQYDIWQAATCGTKNEVVAKDMLYKATSIALQITQGLGCNSDELSALIEDFNTLVDCDCGCLDETPTQLGSTSTVTATNRQTVTADTATTTIDLSAGSNVTINVSATTELDITNIEQFTNYRLIFVASAGGEVISFPSADFEDDNGVVGDITLDVRGVLILDFYAYLSTKLTLVSRSDADDYDRDLQQVSATTAATSVDLNEGNIVNVALAVGGGTTEMSVTNIKENDEYMFIFSRGFSTQEATFSSDFNGPNATVPSVTPLLDDKVVLSFIATSSSELTLTSRSDEVTSAVETVVGTATEIDIDSADAQNPIVSLAVEVTASLALADSALQSGDNVSVLTNDAGYIVGSFQDVGAQTSPYTINFASGSIAYLSFANAAITIDASSIIEGSEYKIIIRNSGAGSQDVTLTTDPFWSFAAISVGSTQVLGITFVCVDIGGTNYLVPTGQQIN